MSDDEVLKFEITDYDLDNEFNINRPRRRQTKHQQIYGIWADESDDDDEETRKGSRSRIKPSKNYSAPIGFVSGGVQNQSKKDEDKDDNEAKSSEEDEETITFNKKSKNYVANSSSDSDEEKPSFSKSAQQFQNFSEINQDIAGLRKSGRPQLNTTLINKGVGNWEKHTKGIGAKLLLQMGYEPGKGLGKDLQGRSTPVEAHLRKGRGAIGAYGPEKTVNKTEEKVDDLADGKKFKDKQNKWKKDNAVGKKSRYYYKSVDDVIERGKQPGVFRTADVLSNLSKVKVIDMTGPEQRILSGYHALSGPKKPQGEGELFEDVIHKKCANFALPELQHNLDLLVDMCEQDIIWVDRKSRHCSDRTVALEQERKTLNEMVEKESKQMYTLESLLNIIERLIDPSHALSLRQVAEEFKNLQENYYEEYLMYDLGELAPGLVGPLITSALVSWSPLSTPNQYTDVFQQWREILDKPNQRATLAVNSTVSQPYNSLVWTTWMPVIRATVSTWSPRDCDPLIRLLETWKSIIPIWIMDNLLEQVVLPQINSEVLQWNPLTDTVPIHIWIHPWIPLMGNKLQETVYPIIEDKLGTALTSWHPSDRSAKLMLRPWQAAMSSGSFAAFLHKYILPKLQVCMSSLIINPHQQHLDAWNWVMDWSDMLNPQAMALLLDKCFFQRWIQTLALWLNQQPNYTEVTDWFIGWKGMFSEPLLQQPSVKEYFRKALELMNRAVKQPSGQQPGALETVSYLTNLETNLPLPPPLSTSTTHSDSLAQAVRTASQIPQSLSFKDIIAKNCEERGILFVPIPNRYREAKQVYRIGSGSTQCYIDKNVIFATTNGTNWAPTNLNNLLDVA